MPMTCPKCSEVRAARVTRRGFLEKYVLERFGYFPWECGACRFRFTMKLRGERIRRTSSFDHRSYHQPTTEAMFGDSRDDVKPAAKAE